MARESNGSLLAIACVIVQETHLTKNMASKFGWILRDGSMFLTCIATLLLVEVMNVKIQFCERKIKGAWLIYCVSAIKRCGQNLVC